MALLVVDADGGRSARASEERRGAGCRAKSQRSKDFRKPAAAAAAAAKRQKEVRFGRDGSRRRTARRRIPIAPENLFHRGFEAKRDEVFPKDDTVLAVHVLVQSKRHDAHGTVRSLGVCLARMVLRCRRSVLVAMFSHGEFYRANMFPIFQRETVVVADSMERVVRRGEHDLDSKDVERVQRKIFKRLDQRGEGGIRCFF